MNQRLDALRNLYDTVRPGAQQFLGRTMDYADKYMGESIVRNAFKPTDKANAVNESLRIRAENIQHGLQSSDPAVKTKAQKELGELRKDQAARFAGQLVGDWADDGTRKIWWLMNAAQAGSQSAGKWALSSEGFTPAQAAIGGAGLTLLMEGMTGNVDVRNLGEAGRPKGYSTLFPVVETSVDPETGKLVETTDRTKSANPIAELGARYFLNRTGRILPEDQFLAERPDVTPEEYARFTAAKRNNTFFGLEDASSRATVPIGAIAGLAGAALTGKPRFAGAIAGGAIAPLGKQIAIDVPTELGIIHGTTETPDDPIGEIEFLGYRLPIKAIAATVAGAAALKYGGRAFRNHGQKTGQLAVDWDNVGRSSKPWFAEEIVKVKPDGGYQTPVPATYSASSNLAPAYVDERQLRLDLDVPGQLMKSEITRQSTGPVVPFSSRGYEQSIDRSVSQGTLPGMGNSFGQEPGQQTGGRVVPSSKQRFASKGRYIPTEVEHSYTPEQLAEIRRRNDPFGQGEDGPWIEYRWVL